MNLLDLSSLSIGPAHGPCLPGISSYRNGRWVHGDEALHHCRLDPQSTILDVWENLSLEPLSPSGGMRHRADLAVAQLQELHLDSSSEWCVAVPMGWTKSVVQIFLGVAQECGLSITGCFPRALLIADQEIAQSDEATVLEWGWKTLSVGKVTCSNEEWSISETEEIADAGLIPCFRRESKLAASWMLDQHRVDPLHSGTTEQDLFMSWWKWHSGQAPTWGGQVNSVQCILSEKQDDLQELHRPLWKNHGIENKATVVASAACTHLSGCEQWVSESCLQLPDLDRLNLEEGKGPRWRQGLKAGAGNAKQEKRITHVVVDGIAEPAPSSLKADPGDLVTLPDGRDGLAIFVPES